MDFEDVKENIQPLASGRNASVLACSLISPTDLLKQREELETAIKDYKGDDPLEPWYEYILWIEQSYPSGGSESGLMKVLLKCLTTFQESKEYYQDRRLIRIFIKYIDTEENPIEIYQELFNYGIGTMTADLYICWAYYYDLAGNFQKADSIFKKGLELRAEPYDELEQAHKHFGFTMSQRILHQDETSTQEFLNSMRERRQALTSLRPHKKKVGSIRTGSVIKSSNPGKIKINEENVNASSYNTKVQVFEDQNKPPNTSFVRPADTNDEHYIPVVRTIIDSARKQENMKEPGPWTKNSKKKGNLYGNTQQANEMGFTILEDDLDIDENKSDIKSDQVNLVPLPQLPNDFSLGIKLPSNFVSKNYPQGVWKVENVVDSEIHPQSYPYYNKIFHYPKPGIEFSTEELFGYKWFKKNGIVNKFTKECKQYFENDINFGIRAYKNFATRNFKEKDNNDKSDFIHSENANIKFMSNLNEMYPGISTGNICDEKQFEEILCSKIKSGQRKLKFDGNETIVIEETMDETRCFTNIVGRKSIFPSRRSMAPFPNEREANMRASILTAKDQSNEGRNSEIKNPFSEILHKKRDKLRKSVITENICRTPLKECDEEHVEQDINIKEASQKECAPKILTSILSTPKTEETLKNSAPIVIQNILLPHIIEVEKNVEKVMETKKQNIIIPSPQPYIDKMETDNKKENKISEEFLVFEDPEQSIKESHPFEFKQPHPIKNVLQQRLTVTIPEIPKMNDDEGFAVDETCSTQAFNLFIKTQSVSTPIGKQNLLKHFKETNEEKCLSKTRKEISFFDVSQSEQKVNSEIANIKADSVNASDLHIVNQATQSHGVPLNISPNLTEHQPKQLSTIMETSEPNTLPTGSTKSTIHKSSGRVSSMDNSNFRSTFTIKENDNQTEIKNILKSSSTQCSVHLDEQLNENKNEAKRQSVIKEINSSVTICLDNEKLKNSENKIELLESSKIINQNPFTNPFPTELATTNKIGESQKQNSKVADDISNNLNVKSIQIFEEKTDTVPNFLLKRKMEIDSPYSYFIKTPVKKNVKQTNLQLDCKTDVIVDNPNENKLPVFCEELLKIIRKSPAPKIQKLSDKQDENTSEEKDLAPNINRTKHTFQDQLPIFSNLKDLTLPKLLEKDVDKTFENIHNKSHKLSFLQKSLKVMNDDKCLSKGDQSLFKGNNFSLKNIKIEQNQSGTTEYNKLGFEDNVQTDAFALNISQIKNSTFLPAAQMEKQIMQKSLHIYQENPIKQHILDTNKAEINCNKIVNEKKIDKCENYSVSEGAPCLQMQSLNINEKLDCFEIQETDMIHYNDTNDLGRSIYNKPTFKTPILAKHIWSDIECDEHTDEEYVHTKVDSSDQTKFFINENLIQPNMNPFSIELNKAFIESIEFTNYLLNVDSCELTGKIRMLCKGDEIKIKDKIFCVLKIIGEGAYGTIWSAKEKSSGKMYALKQEKPANLWEYYICLELKSRLENVRYLSGFMDVEYAIIGNNASILVSEFSPYSSFLAVCNNYKNKTSKNLDEYIVMIITSQMLAIIDHLHASKMIHGDIKADNFLLMKKLSYPFNEVAIQLIDFGISIDMNFYPDKHTFTYKRTKEDFKCIEMREDRPWTYQADLFGVAGVIHVLLYGKYMDVQKNVNGYWSPKQRVPRYLNKNIWEKIFQSLLNVRDCYTMPNLQSLRILIDQTLLDKEKYVIDKVFEFNSCLD